MHDASSSAPDTTVSSAAPISPRRGARALVVERRSLIGGACVTESPWPGYKVSSASYVMSLMQPKIILDLELKKHGLEVIEAPPTTVLIDQQRCFVPSGPTASRLYREIAAFSKRDADAYPKYRAVA